MSHDLGPAKNESMAWIASRFAPLVIGVAIVAAYLNTLDGAFLFDDFESIVDNPSIRSMWPLSQSLWGPQDTPTAGRPVVNFSFAVNYAAGELNVYGYHVVNLVLHCLNVAILFALMYRTLSKIPFGVQQPEFAWGASAMAAAIWVLHPIQTEAVTNVTQRSELWMAFFMLMTIYAAERCWDAEVRFCRIIWQSISIVSCSLGMASKEVMVVAPIIVFMYDITIRKASLSTLIKRRWTLYLGLAATWGILAALMMTNPRSSSVGFGLLIRPLDYLTTQFWAITHYLWLVFWPSGLCADYGIFVVTDIRTWFPCLLLLLGLAGLTFWSFVRGSRLAFLGVWFFLLLAPTSSFVPIASEPVAERRMYLPLAAVVVLVVLTFIELLRRLPVSSTGNAKIQLNRRIKLQRILIGVALFMILAGLAAATHSRNYVFQTELTFWKDVTNKRPKNPRGFSSLGTAYANDHQRELAKASFLQALEIDPSHHDAHYNLGLWYLEAGQANEAIAHFESSRTVNPRSAKASWNLGKCYSLQGRLAEAITEYDRAIAIKPTMIEAIFNRGLIFISQRRLAEAIRDFDDVIRISPAWSPAYFQLGRVYLSQEHFDKAIEKYLAAFRIDPQSVGSCINLGAAYAAKREFTEAIRWFKQSLQLDARNSDVFNNIGYCYASLGQMDEAIEAYTQCLAIQPNDSEAWFSLGTIYAGRRQLAEARHCFERALQIKPDIAGVREALQQLDGK